jgi:branched-chain amino acid aminotransferase
MRNTCTMVSLRAAKASLMNGSKRDCLFMKLSESFITNVFSLKIICVECSPHWKNGNIKIVINYNNGLSKVPQVFIYQIKHYYPTSREYDKGINTSLLYGKRNRPNAKFINLKINQLVAEEFEHKNIHETLFVDENGNLTEGSKSNLFFVKDWIVYTPSDKGVLPGITRKHVIELCRELNISLTKTSIHISSIKDYDAAFITGTSVKILPIKHINHIEFNVKNKTMLRLMRCFDIKIDNYLLGTKESCSSIKK